MERQPGQSWWVFKGFDMLPFASWIRRTNKHGASLQTCFTAFALAILLIIITGCNSSPKGGTEVPMTIKVTSPAFAEGENIPKKFSCDGDNVSPALSWSGTPDGTKSLALIVDDPDAPSGTFVHWVFYNIPAGQNSLPEGAGSQSASSTGTQGTNGARKSGYSGPCPPKGPAHRYYFKIYALDSSLNLKAGATKSDVEKGMQSHVLAQGQLMGKYGR